MFPVKDFHHFSALREHFICAADKGGHNRHTGVNRKHGRAAFNLAENTVFAARTLRVNDDAPVLAKFVAQAVHRLHIDAASVHGHHAGGFNQLAAERIVAEQFFFRHAAKLFKALFRERGGKIEIVDFGDVVCANDKPLVGRDIVGVVDIDMIAKLRHIAEKRIGVIVAVGLFQRIHDIGFADLLFLRSLILQRQHNVAHGHIV